MMVCLMKAGAQAILCLARPLKVQLLRMLSAFSYKLARSCLMPDKLSSHQVQLDVIQCLALAQVVVVSCGEKARSVSSHDRICSKDREFKGLYGRVDEEGDRLGESNHRVFVLGRAQSFTRIEVDARDIPT